MKINNNERKSYIKEIFLKHDHQDNVIIDLYKMILPRWDDIEKLNGHPVCGEKLWHYICELFINFDKIHHPRCLAGGAWINFGFSSDSQLAPWEINLSGYSIIYKETLHVEHTNGKSSEYNTKTV
jgi:hypothetical protein